MSTCVQSSLAQLGIPFNDVVKVLVAILLLGNILFYEAKNQELSVQGVEGTYGRSEVKWVWQELSV